MADLATTDAQPTSPGIATDRRPEDSSRRQSGRHVLVVDDEDGMRLVLGRVLTRLGYEMILADSLASGIEMLAAHPDLDAVIADLTMPTLTGLQFARAIIEHHPAVPILFLTGGPTASGALDDPLIGLVAKPVGIDNLRTQLQALIDRAHQTLRNPHQPSTPGSLSAGEADAVIGHPDRRVETDGRIRILPELDASTATWAAVSGLAGLEGVSAVPGAAESQRLASLGLFAAGVANQVNNMLAVVTMRADLLREGEPGQDMPDAVVEDAEAIAAAAARASQLAQQLMLFAGQRTVDRGPVDVAAVVSHLLPRLDEVAGGRGVVVADVEPVPDVTADHEHIERIILNLVRNALEATRAPATAETAVRVSTRAGLRSPRVRIRVAPSPTGRAPDAGPAPQPPAVEGTTPAGVVVEIADSGEGMSDNVQARAVEPFFRAYTSTGGSGLGLSIVQGLVSQLNGQLHIDSSLGQGTTVRVTIPSRPDQTTTNSDPQ